MFIKHTYVTTSNDDDPTAVTNATWKRRVFSLDRLRNAVPFPVSALSKVRGRWVNDGGGLRLQVQQADAGVDRLEIRIGSGERRRPAGGIEGLAKVEPVV